MSTVLVVGAGGREHALAWRLAQSPHVTRLILAPGNAGMHSDWERWMISQTDGKPDYISLAVRAKNEGVSLVVVGPDDPLAAGIVDVFEAEGILCMGPSGKAAQIEASKSLAKDVMLAAGIPTARHWTVTSVEEARKILVSVPWVPGGGWVIKADGLALGKGVQVCDSFDAAEKAVSELFPLFKKLVIEEKLHGEEISWMAFCDGQRCALLDPARDYKRLLNKNQGPNTGGMGSFSPVPGIPEGLEARIRSQVFLPALAEMKKRGIPFRGVLYAGLMFDAATDQFWVLEFNARFGDPETQVLMPRMEGDFFEWCIAVAKGDMSSLPERVPFSRETALYVVAASRGYPGHTDTGKRVELRSGALGTYFFSGVRYENKDLVTSGGRVLGALGVGGNLALAKETAYRALSEVHFEGMQFRSDIGDLE
ncbi:MAG: phosphoribosylamine--glycine ligase [Bdellovibrio sp.]|nr:phosphoribosylamine--glycine ligase [Bdellovibrio sp.]